MKTKPKQQKVFPIVVEKDFDKPYFQRGRYHFLIYCLDGSIKGERAGLYIPPVIFFDNLKIYIQEKDKIYNLHRYIKKVELNISETHHYFDFKGIKIKLTYFVPEDFVGLQIFIETTEPLTFLFEPLFSFNYVWHENPVKEFDIFTKDGCVYARSKFDIKIGCMFKANKPLQLITDKNQKNKISIKGKDITITIAGSIKSEQNLRTHMKELLTGRNPRKRKQRKYEDRILDCLEFYCDDSELNKAFTLAKHNLRLLRHHQPGLGQGYLAGLPFFAEFFGRDTFWSIPGILCLGDFDCVKSNLNIFSRHQSELTTETKKPGKIAHEIWLTGECNYYSIDANSLFIYALYNYYQWTADLEYLKDIFDIVKKTVECDIDSSKNHMLIHGPLGFLKGITWMDSISRSKTGVDVQALFVNELKLAAELATIVGEKKLAAKWLSFAKKAAKKLELFWSKSGNYYVDRIKPDNSQDKSFTPNAFVLLLLGLADKKRAELHLEKASKKLLTPFGISTLEKSHPVYCSVSYHHGSAWPLLSGWYTLALLHYNKIEEAFKIIKSQTRFYETYVPGFAPECIDAKTGGANFIISELGTREKEKGSKPSWIQLWSSSLFLQALIEGICGIKPLPPNKLKIEPNLPKELNYVELKSLRIFDSIVNIRIERKGQKIIKKVKIRKGKVKLV